MTRLTTWNKILQESLYPLADIFSLTLIEANVAPISSVDLQPNFPEKFGLPKLDSVFVETTSPLLYLPFYEEIRKLDHPRDSKGSLHNLLDHVISLSIMTFNVAEKTRKDFSLHEVILSTAKAFQICLGNIQFARQHSPSWNDINELQALATLVPQISTNASSFEKIKMIDSVVETYNLAWRQIVPIYEISRQLNSILRLYSSLPQTAKTILMIRLNYTTMELTKLRNTHLHHILECQRTVQGLLHARSKDYFDMLYQEDDKDAIIDLRFNLTSRKEERFIKMFSHMQQADPQPSESFMRTSELLSQDTLNGRSLNHVSPKGLNAIINPTSSGELVYFPPSGDFLNEKYHPDLIGKETRCIPGLNETWIQFLNITIHTLKSTEMLLLPELKEAISKEVDCLAKSILVLPDDFDWSG